MATETKAKSNLDSLIKTTAPLIASASGTPFASMAKKILVGKVLGTEESKNDSEKKLEVALAAPSMEPLEKIQKAEEEFKANMEQLGVDLEKITAGDRADARAREITLKDKTPSRLAILYTSGFFIIIFFVMSFPLPQGSKDLINTLIGVVSAAQVGIIGYYFGSSSGSARKTELMGKQ